MHLSAMGLDGVVLSWVNYETELAYWISDVLPLMEQADLRRPYASTHASRYACRGALLRRQGAVGGHPVQGRARSAGAAAPADAHWCTGWGGAVLLPLGLDTRGRMG